MNSRFNFTDGWVTFNFLGNLALVQALHTLVVWSADVSGGDTVLAYSGTGGTGR
jgi:hypothetical protein